jgi:hypothetical protein
MAQTACVIFGAVYLWYWALILVKVRYAIAPFALLALVAAAWMKTFYDSRRDRVGRAARLCVIAVMTYCLVIAIMGLMIVGINGPQLAYFAGGIDKPGYLRAAMQAYGAVEFVAQTGTHGAVLGIESEARAYSADPVSFHAMWCTRNPCTPERVAAAVERMRPEYLIVPENGDVPPEALARIGNPARVYQDAHFGVYHLSKLSK